MESKRLARILDPSRSKRVFSDEFGKHYVSPDALDPKMRGKTTPTGIHNLQAFREFSTMKRFKEALKRRTPTKSFRVLFDGFSTPFNVVAMQQFLVEELEIPASAIHISAIDLDERAMQKGKELALEHGIRFDFSVDDAGCLHSPDGLFSLVFQDFLLNCAPLGQHIDILKETQRVLDPEFGLGMICWTSAEGHLGRIFTSEGLTLSEAELRSAFKVQDIQTPAFRIISGLAGKSTQLLLQITDLDNLTSWILVTTNGDFEFFRSQKDIHSILQYSGLFVMESRLDVGVDRFQNVCWRNRFLLTGNPELISLETPELLGMLGDNCVE